MTDLFLIVGLGNPGTRYVHNRHNIGFLALDEIARKYATRGWSSKFAGQICEAQIAGVKAHLLKPETYMNLSGESVAACARFYKIEPSHIIVLHDELDLLPGKLKVKRSGGAGGHNGIKSIDAHMGEEYLRVRIGIGHPGDRNRVSDYVLSDFGKEEWLQQEKMLDAIKETFALLLEDDTAGFMNKVALILNPPPPKKPPAADA